MLKPGPYLKGTFDENGYLFPEDNQCKFDLTLTPVQLFEMLEEVDKGEAIDTGLRQELDYKFCPSLKNKVKLAQVKKNPKVQTASVLFR